MDKPENEARDAVGAHAVDICGALGYGKVASVGVGVLRGGRALTSMQHVTRNLFSKSSSTSLRIGRYAMVSRDISLFRFWLQCCQAAAKMKRKDDFATTNFLSEDFQFALERGYIEEVAEMIKMSGGELPLDALIKKTGIDKAEKPKYYQGLSIGGKKMAGWARERGEDSYRSPMSESTPPILQAAKAGSLAAVEWFLSDTPLRLYKEYKDQNKDDTRLRKLAEAPGGFHSVVGQWLKQRSEPL